MGQPELFNSRLVMLSGYIAGALVMLGVAILIGAIMLRLASYVLRFPLVRFENAVYATAVSAITLFSIQFSIMSNYFGMAGIIMQGNPYGQNFSSTMAFSLSPMYMSMMTALGILLTALIYQRLLSFEDVDHEIEETSKEFQLNFGDAVTLAAVQVGVSMLCCLVIGFVIAFGFILLTSL